MWDWAVIKPPGRCFVKSVEILSVFSLQPTSKNRGWLIDPLGSNPWWTLPMAALPALLCTILIFMDQQITAVIINRKEHKLKVRAALVVASLMCPALI